MSALYLKFGDNKKCCVNKADFSDAIASVAKAKSKYLPIFLGYFEARLSNRLFFGQFNYHNGQQTFSIGLCDTKGWL